MSICRLCSSEDNLMFMFDERRQRAMQLLRYYILQGTGIEIKETDVISKMVCHRCCEIAVKLHKYRTNAVANDKLLKEQNGVPYTPPITDESELLRIASEMCNGILIDGTVSPEAFDLLNISPKTVVTAEQCNSNTSILSSSGQPTNIVLNDQLNSDVLCLQTPNNENVEVQALKVSEPKLTGPQNATLKKSLQNVDNYTSLHQLEISNFHPSIKNILTKNNNLIMPAEALTSDLSPVVSLDSAEVSDWYASQLSTIRRKLSNIVIKKVADSTHYQIQPHPYKSSQDNVEADAHIISNASDNSIEDTIEDCKAGIPKIIDCGVILISSDSEDDSMDRDQLPPEHGKNGAESCSKSTHSAEINIPHEFKKPIYTARKSTSRKPHSSRKRPVGCNFDSDSVGRNEVRPLAPPEYDNNRVESGIKESDSAVNVPPGLHKPIYTARKSTSRPPYSEYNGNNRLQSWAKATPSSVTNVPQGLPTARKRTSRKPNSNRKRSVRQSDIAEVIPQKKKRIYSNKDALPPLNKIDLPQQCPPDKKAQKAIFTSSLELTPIEPLPELVDCQNVLTTGRTLDIFMCPVCGLPCTSKRQLQDHRRTHLTCKYCKTTIKTIELMKKHLEESCFITLVKDNAVVKLTRVDSLPSVIKQYPEAFDISKPSVNLHCDEDINNFEEFGMDSEGTQAPIGDLTSTATGDKNNEEDEVVIITTNVEVFCISDDSGDEIESAIPVHKIVQQPASEISAPVLEQQLESDTPEPASHVQSMSITGFPGLQKNVTEKEMIRSLFKKYSDSTNKSNRSAQTFAPVSSNIKYTNTNLIVLENMFSELLAYKIPIQLESQPKISARFEDVITTTPKPTLECWLNKEPIDVVKPNSYGTHFVLSTNSQGSNTLIPTTKPITIIHPPKTYKYTLTNNKAITPTPILIPKTTTVISTTRTTTPIPTTKTTTPIPITKTTTITPTTKSTTLIPTTKTTTPIPTTKTTTPIPTTKTTTITPRTKTTTLIPTTKTTTPIPTTKTTTPIPTTKAATITPTTKTTTLIPTTKTTTVIQTTKTTALIPTTKTTTLNNATSAMVNEVSTKPIKTNAVPPSKVTAPNANASVTVAVPEQSHSSNTQAVLPANALDVYSEIVTNSLTTNAASISNTLVTNCANQVNTMASKSVIEKQTFTNTDTTGGVLRSVFTKSILKTPNNVKSVCSSNTSLTTTATAPVISISTVPVSASLVHSNNILLPATTQSSSIVSGASGTLQCESYKSNQVQPASFIQIVETPNTGINQHNSSENVSFGIANQTQPSNLVQLMESPTPLPYTPVGTFQKNTSGQVYEQPNSIYSISKNIQNVNNIILVANPHFPLLATNIQETPVSSNNLPQIAMQPSNGLHATSFLNTVTQAPILYDPAVQNQQLSEPVRTVDTPPTQSTGYVRVKSLYELSN